MTTKLTKQEPQSQYSIDIDEIKKIIAPTATDAELQTFANICSAYQLNPFKREIYFVKYGGTKANIIVGYEVYLKRAERTGKLNGWSVHLEERNGEVTTATITIYRKDWEKPFLWTVYRKEYDTGKASWASMPYHMLRKVCIAQGFRLAFPDELGGMPYTQEELMDKPVLDEENVKESPSESIAEEKITKTRRKTSKKPESKLKPLTEGTVETKPAEPEPVVEEETEIQPEPEPKVEAEESEKNADEEEPQHCSQDTIDKVISTFAKFEVNPEDLEKIIGRSLSHLTEDDRDWLIQKYWDLEDDDLSVEDFKKMQMKK